MKGYLTKTQAAERLGCGSRTIDKWIEEGLLVSIKTSLNATQQTTLISLPSIELWEQRRGDLSVIKAKINEKEDFLSKIDAELECAMKEYEKNSVFLKGINLLIKNENAFWIKNNIIADTEKEIYQDYLECNGDWESLSKQYQLSKRTIKIKVSKTMLTIGQHLIDYIMNVLTENENLKQDNEQNKDALQSLQEKVNAYEKVIKDFSLKSIGPLKSLLTTRVSEFSFSQRANSVLKSKNVHYVYELIQLTERDFAVRNCGNKTIKEIKNWMNEQNLSFGRSFTVDELNTLKTIADNN